MRYYSEDTVDKIVQDVVFGKKNVFFSEYPSVEIPDKHGDLYDKKDVVKVLFHQVEDVSPICDWTEIMPILDDVPVIVPSTKEPTRER